MTVDASSVTGYLDIADVQDMRENLVISPYLVNRSLSGAGRAANSVAVIRVQIPAPALLVRCASSGSQGRSDTTEGWAHASLLENLCFSRIYTLEDKGEVL